MMGVYTGTFSDVFRKIEDIRRNGAAALDLAWVAASGAKSLQSIRIKVGPAEDKPRKFQVRIVYLEQVDPVKQLPAFIQETLSNSKNGIIDLEIKPLPRFRAIPTAQ